MNKIEFQHTTGNGLTLLGLDEIDPKDSYSSKVRIDGKDYKTEIVYDLANHIAIRGDGDFLNKEIQFFK